MLPCNVIVFVNDEGETVVVAIDPVASMEAVNNSKIVEIAKEIQAKL